MVQGLEDLEISRRVETIKNSALLRSARILRRVLEIWGDLLSPGGKNFKIVKLIIIIINRKLAEIKESET